MTEGPPVDTAAASDPQGGMDDEEEWFGDGSAFDSGEDLAAALFAMAGAPEQMPHLEGGAADYLTVDDAPEEAYDTGRPPSATPQRQVETAFQVVERTALPGPRATESWGVRPQGIDRNAPRASRTGWGMRHSVQMLKTTEEVITRLRKDAVEVAFQAAFLAFLQQQGRKLTPVKPPSRPAP